MTPKASPSLLKKLDPTRLPRHVAIIMDGNGRWASKRKFGRIRGHRAGIHAIRHTTSIAAKLSISCVTLYAFSTENWNRPQLEINALWNLLVEYLNKEVPKLVKNNIRLDTIGNPGGLPETVLKKLQWAKQITANSSGLKLILALNYGSRQEILEAVRGLLKKAVDPVSLTEEDFSYSLYTKDYPDPDLLIRTSGEKRLSNFLLWQLSYAELVFLDVLWPDFTEEHFISALLEFQSRKRRFGGLEHA